MYQGTQDIFTTSSTYSDSISNHFVSYKETEGQKRLFLDIENKKGYHTFNFAQMAQNLVCSIIGA